MSLNNLDKSKLSIAVNTALIVLKTGSDIINTVEKVATATVNFYTAFIKNVDISGSSKKDIVLSLIQQTWNEIVENPNSTIFSDWAKRISDFIDVLHSAYNSLVTDLTVIKNSLFGGVNAESIATTVKHTTTVA